MKQLTKKCLVTAILLFSGYSLFAQNSSKKLLQNSTNYTKYNLRKVILLKFGKMVCALREKKKPISGGILTHI